MLVECVVIMGNVEVWLKENEEFLDFIDLLRVKFLKREVYDCFYFYVDRME